MGRGEKSLTSEKTKKKKSWFKRFSDFVTPNQKKSIDLANKDRVERIPTSTGDTNVQSTKYRKLNKPVEIPKKSVAQLGKRNLGLIGDIVYAAKSDTKGLPTITEQPRSLYAVTDQPQSKNSKISSKWNQSERARRNDIPTETPLYKSIRQRNFRASHEFWKNITELTDNKLNEPALQNEIQEWEKENEREQELTEELSNCQERKRERERNITELCKTIKEKRKVAPVAQDPIEEEVTASSPQYLNEPIVVCDLVPACSHERNIGSSQESLNVQDEAVEIDDLCSGVKKMEIDTSSSERVSVDAAETGLEVRNLVEDKAVESDIAPPLEARDDFTEMAMEAWNLQPTDVDGSGNEDEIFQDDLRGEEITNDGGWRNSDAEVTFEGLEQSDEASVNLRSYNEVVGEKEEQQSSVQSEDENGYSTDDSDSTLQRPRKRQRSRSQRRFHKQKDLKEKYPKTEHLPRALSEQTGCDSGSQHANESDIGYKSDLESENGISQKEESDTDGTSGISSGQEERYSNSSTETDAPPKHSRMSQDARRDLADRKRKHPQKRNQNPTRPKKYFKKDGGPRRKAPMAPGEKRKFPRKMTKSRQKYRRTPGYQKDWLSSKLARVNGRVDAVFSLITTLMMAKTNDNDSKKPHPTTQHSDAKIANLTINGNANINQNDVFAQNLAARDMDVWNKHCMTGMTHAD